MWLLKISVIIVFISKSLADSSDIFLQNVDFIVGIFEENPESEYPLKYLNQGVLVSQRIVLTSSINLFEDMDLLIKRYSWSQVNLNDDHKIDKVSRSNSFEYKVQNISPFSQMPEISALYLEKPVKDIQFLNYNDYYKDEKHNLGNKCALVKFKINNSFSKVQVKQRGIKPKKYFLEAGCSKEVVSKSEKLYSPPLKNYYCVTEIGKRNYHTQAGNVLICESHNREGYYYLAGINTLRDGCELMFANTQILIEIVLATGKGDSSSTSTAMRENLDPKLLEQPFFKILGQLFLTYHSIL